MAACSAALAGGRWQILSHRVPCVPHGRSRVRARGMPRSAGGRKLDAKLDAKLEAKLKAKLGAKPEAKLKAKLEAKLEAKKLEAKLEAKR